MVGRLFQNRATEPIYSTISGTYTNEFFIDLLMTQDLTQMQGKSEIKSSYVYRSFFLVRPSATETGGPGALVTGSALSSDKAHTET